MFRKLLYKYFKCFDPIRHCTNYKKCCATDTWICPCENTKIRRVSK